MLHENLSRIWARSSHVVWAKDHVDTVSSLFDRTPNSAWLAWLAWQTGIGRIQLAESICQVVRAHHSALTHLDPWNIKVVEALEEAFATRDPNDFGKGWKDYWSLAGDEPAHLSCAGDFVSWVNHALSVRLRSMVAWCQAGWSPAAEALGYLSLLIAIEHGRQRGEAWLTTTADALRQALPRDAIVEWIDGRFAELEAARNDAAPQPPLSQCLSRMGMPAPFIKSIERLEKGGPATLEQVFDQAQDPDLLLWLVQRAEAQRRAIYHTLSTAIRERAAALEPHGDTPWYGQVLDNLDQTIALAPDEPLQIGLKWYGEAFGDVPDSLYAKKNKRTHGITMAFLRLRAMVDVRDPAIDPDQRLTSSPNAGNPFADLATAVNAAEGRPAANLFKKASADAIRQNVSFSEVEAGLSGYFELL